MTHRPGAGRRLQERDGRSSLARFAAIVSIAAVVTCVPLSSGAAMGWADPLAADPPVLENGAVLPGDRQPVACAASRDFSADLTLADAVDIALCANPRVLAAWAEIKEKANGVGVAKAGYLPTLTGSIGHVEDRTWYPDGGSVADRQSGLKANVRLAWRLLDFGEREGNLDAARNLLAAAVTTNDATLQQTMAQVIQSYFDAETAQADLAAKQEAVDIAARTLDTAQSRRTDKKGSEGDVLQAQTRLAHARLDVSRAFGRLDKAKAVLAFALGAAPGTSLALKPLEPPRTGELDRSLTAWLEMAQAHHPSIEAARAQVRVAEARARVTRSQGLPTVNLGAAFYENGRPSQTLHQSRETVVGVSIRIPLFDGFATTYRSRGAAAFVEQREAELRQAELRVGLNVVEAYSDASAALKNLDASDALLKAAWAALQSTQRNYQRGTVDVLESLSSQQALAQAQEERIRCLAEWHSASLRIMTAAGQLGFGRITE